MKTKSEVILVSGLIDNIKKDYTEEDYAPFKYAFLRNGLNFKRLFKERDSIIAFLYEEFKKENPEDKLGENGQFSDEAIAYFNNHDNFKNFLKEETDLEYYTVDIKTLENSKYNLEVATLLLDTILTEG